MRKRRGRISLTVLGLGLGLMFAPALAQDALTEGEVSGSSSIGPDVIVSSLQFSNILWHDYDPTLTGYVTAYSIGTQSCNIGTVPIQWQISPSTQHPVIRTSMYRLKSGRFEQIGQSWVKHGFWATNEPLCNSLCTTPGGDGQQLWPGCGDPYDASLNSTRSYLGPTLQINGFTGTFSNPVPHPSTANQLNGRLQVHNVDVDPAENMHARYYMAGHYIAADDAAAGNAHNNFSYQRVNVVPAPAVADDTCLGTDPQKFCLYYTDFLREQEAPIRAWKREDPNVVETDALVPGEGLFILAAKATDLGTGFWRYEYALQNVNSDRSGKSLTVPIALGSVINNVGFHDVEYHSGEPISNTDWTPSVLSGKVIWTTEDYSVNVNANALRWGTLYNFRFDSNAPPDDTTVALDLFKPGSPTKINIATIGPIIGFIDCNANGVADGCDVDCGGVECTAPCGGSDDCNNNSVPDECETDCNENGLADTCDLVPFGESEDCNENFVPDECEEDCDNNGVPDNCEPVPDCDGDGWDDCADQCPCSTPPDGCAPPDYVCCRYDNGIMIPGYPYVNCVGDGGTPLCDAEGFASCDFDPPLCPTSTCREGCLVGDGDGDGDFDLADYNLFLVCFSGETGSPAFIQPSVECRSQFDYDENSAVDLMDMEQFRRELAGP